MSNPSLNPWPESRAPATASDPSLPEAPSLSEAPLLSEAPSLHEAPSAESSRVLIVTGRLRVRAVGTTVLRGAGFQVDVATNGKEVLADLENLRPDLILTEAALDDMSAARLCAQVRALGVGKVIPILTISDFSDPRDIQKILTQDLTDVVFAPVNWRVLTLRVHRWIAMAARFRSLGDHDQDFEEVRESALKASTELLQLRNYDSLTGLPNREMFVDSLELIVAQSQRTASYCAVLCLDIDDFQGVNDLIGRSLGDELLRLIAGRLQGCLREDDLVSQMGDEGSLVSFARVNADQFAILLASVPNQKAAAAVARRLQANLAQPLNIRDREFRLTAAIGIADSLNLDEGGEEALLQRAEIAMRYCKQREGTSCAVFESFMNDLVVQKLELKAELRKALEREELILFYQLLVDARTGAPNGVEGLVRWNHPVRGLVPPNDFLPVAEESDLIVEVDRWVLREGCRQGKDWLDKGFAPLLMSLNVSMRFLAEEDFAEQVLAIVEETGMPADWLQLELSERGNLPDAGRIMGQFEMLVDKGIHLALDDFGTGQTSLSYLRTLPISCVKVDQSFVRRVPGDSASVAIVTAIGAMSHHLKLKVVAEGVETTEHWRFLSENGYDQLQGYLFSKPERVEELETGFRHLVGWREMIASRSPQAQPQQPPAQVARAGGQDVDNGGSPRAESRGADHGETEDVGASDWQGSEADLLKLARNDFLTKLYNRFSFDERLEHAVADADRFGHKVALLLIDLDDFKYINDTYGHAVGDAVLVAVASRLKKLVRKADTLARIGGDEFAVILSEFQDIKHVAELGERLLQILGQKVVLEGRELRVNGSLGVSVYPAGSTQATDLLRQADLALYKAKKHGGNGMRFFAREMDWEVKRRLALAQDLSGVVERGELYLEYQLQIAFATGSVVGVEALLRWDHPAKGLIGPERLIPIAESTGDIRSIGRWVIRSACAQAKRWQEAYGRDVPVSVNLSPVQCRDHGFVDGVVQALTDHQLAPQLLHLELNERLLTQLPEEFEGSLKRLGELGVQLTLDNFGTGFSALKHFQRFQFDRMKVHQSLVRTLGEGSSSSPVLSGIFALARKMEVQIVAEGVETSEEVEALAAEGCEIGQGFLFSKPVVADELSEFISKPGTLADRVPVTSPRNEARLAPVLDEVLLDPLLEAVPPAPRRGDDAQVSIGFSRDTSETRVAETETSKAGIQDDVDREGEASCAWLVDRVASLSAEPIGPTETATEELRKLDSFAATFARRAPNPWRRRLPIAAMIVALTTVGSYVLPWEFLELGAFQHQPGTAKPRRVGGTSSVPLPTSGLEVTEPAGVGAAAAASRTGASEGEGRRAIGESSPLDTVPGHETTGAARPFIDFAQAWARAWSEQRVDDYLRFYAREFRPSDGQDRGDWEQQRRVRIRKPRRIEVSLSDVEAERVSAERAQIRFVQNYRSDAFEDRVGKILELIREDGVWKIATERVKG